VLMWQSLEPVNFRLTMAYFQHWWQWCADDFCHCSGRVAFWLVESKRIKTKLTYMTEMINENAGDLNAPAQQFRSLLNFFMKMRNIFSNWNKPMVIFSRRSSNSRRMHL
jgi:hypothetical protein